MKNERPFLLININNTNTSFALANARRIPARCQSAHSVIGA